MATLREAELYDKLSEDHLTQASESLARYRDQIRCVAGEAVLDVGCGSGRVTHQVILPSLHPAFSTLVGIDISKEMIDFASNRWSEDRLRFVAMDAAERDTRKIHESLPTTKFDKIFSFYALQWISDRRQLALNLSSLLIPGGQAFLILVSNSGAYAVWDSLACCKKWSKYFQKVKVPLNEYQYMKDPGQVTKRCLETAGLQVTSCQTQFHSNAFSSNTDTDEDKIARLKSVDPLVNLVPQELKDEYMKDVLECSNSLLGPRGAVDYTSLTIICNKPSLLST